MGPGPALLLLLLLLLLGCSPPPRRPPCALARAPRPPRSPAGTPRPPPARPAAAGTRCPPGSAERALLSAANSSDRAAGASVACQRNRCVITQVKINRDEDPVSLGWKEETSLNATIQMDCESALLITEDWQYYSVHAVNEEPKWTQPLDIGLLRIGPRASIIRIPRQVLPWGVYLFNFTVTIIHRNPENPKIVASDSVYLRVVRRPLRAVLLGDAKVTIKFSDELIVNGTLSSDPEADNPSEGLRFSWYCTTNPGNYAGNQITLASKEVCHPEQADLSWPWASGPVLTVSPGTLKGNSRYHFRMVVEKGYRSAFADKTVAVLQGPLPTAQISCLENCDRTLAVSDRFSLFLNCTDCVSRDFYNWSILSSAGNEMPFDWTGQTVTGKNGAYLSVKAFAFRHFLEARFWVSVALTSWSGAALDYNYSFIINHGPQIGTCQINPAKGIAVFTKFVIRCHNFKDVHIPLTYKIIISDLDGGEISSVKENTLGAILYLGTESTTPPFFLPVGVLADHYSLKIGAHVYDSLGAFSQVTLYATVQAPTDRNSSKTVLRQLQNFTQGPTSLLSTLLQKQDLLPAGYLMYIVASILNSIKTKQTLQDDMAKLREHLVNQSFVLPVSTLEEISQVVMTIAKLTQKASEFTPVAQKHATVRVWQANRALQEYRHKDKRFHAEQIEIVSTGILMTLSNILKLITPHEVVEDPFKVLESLSDTMLAIMVPGKETTVLRTPSFNMYVEKVEKWDVTQAFRNEKRCRNCFHATLNASRVPDLPAKAPVSAMFCEFSKDPFPWFPENTSAEVVGFRMTGAADNGSVMEITPDVAEVYLVRKNLTSATFNLTVGPSSEWDESSKMTTGGFSFEVDSRNSREVLIHIVTKVTVLFKVLVYAGSRVAPADLVATFLVPHDSPPVVDHNRNGLFDPACAVKEARVVCLPPSLLHVIAQRSPSLKCAIAVVLRAPRFVLEPSDKVVRISLFSAHCLDMYGIQSDWREGTCLLGEKTTWNRLHCVCRNTERARRQLGVIKLTFVQLHTRYTSAKVIVVPNPVDLSLHIIQKLNQNPVTLFSVLFIMLIYIVLAFWALHKDEIDQFLRDHVIVLPDNDPYDNICYLVTVFTGSRLGSGTRANVFVQLTGTEGTSDVHCLSHPYFTSLYRGGIDTFLLTTKSDLGDIRSIRVWHNNEGKAPSWYLSRIKVENLFSRHIWLFMCRKWLSIDTTLDKTFYVIHPDKPLKRKDFFLIDLTYKLGKNHLWFSIFATVVAKSFNRLQRLSCCLAMLLSSLLCNIMFFNLNKDDSETREGHYARSMIIGIESVLLTIPIQLLITFFFTYSQKKPQVNLDEVAPRKHPLMSEEVGHWQERLFKWHAQETARARTGDTARARKPAKPILKGQPAPPKASLQPTFKRGHQRKKAETKAPKTNWANTNASNRNVEDNQDVRSRESSLQEETEQPKIKPRIVLPWWCVYVAWLLVFVTCSVSSFFIVFYGLTYGYDKSVEWLFASFCSFCQSVFLVQPSKIILWSGMRTKELKYSKNLSWSTKYRYSEIKLSKVKVPPDEMETLHQHIVYLQGSRMYQPLTEDEIRIFKRKKRIRKRAILFLSYFLTHFIFLALLLLLIALLRHTDSFHYNQFMREQFSVGLAAVTKLQDIYGWLNRVLLPLLHNDLNPAFLYDSSSQILGLPLMRQVRAKLGEKICLPAENLVENSITGEIRCRPMYGIDPEDTKNYSSFWKGVGMQAGNNTNGFIYKPPEKRWVYYSHGLLNTYGSGGYAFYFFPEEQQFNSTVRLKELQGSNWLDEKTWAVILELTTFNPDVNLFCSISIVFEASQLGAVNSSVSTRSFSLADFNREMSAEVYLYVALLIFFVAYMVDEGYIITQERASYVRSVYNLLNFALKCLFTVLIVLFVSKHVLATGMIRFYLSNPKDFIPFHAVSQVDHTMRVVLAFLLFLTILKTLRYSRFFYDVRLAQRAIQAALPGICHMAFVVSVYFFVYMAFGYLVFGQHEWNYSKLIHASQTIFSYCVSAFQNTEFSSNRVLGVLFLSSFMLVMICILINLFQAVILSAYEEMKQPVYEEPSEEVEAMAYLCRKLRTMFSFLTPPSKTEDEPKFLTNMLYGQPEKNSHRYLGLKTRNINGKKMVYLVV